MAAGAAVAAAGLAGHPDALDDLLYVTLGIILGGRLGYVLFYQPGHHLSHPLDIRGVARRHVVPWRPPGRAGRDPPVRAHPRARLLRFLTDALAVVT